MRTFEWILDIIDLVALRVGKNDCKCVTGLFWDRSDHAISNLDDDLDPRRQVSLVKAFSDGERVGAIRISG